jgi:hypothetical protein
VSFCIHCANRKATRCDDTRCSLADPTRPYDIEKMCRPCWIRLGGSPGDKTKPHPCRHLGAVTEERVLCPSCRGKVELKLHACNVHGRCTLVKGVGGTACCTDCPDYASSYGVPDASNAVYLNMGAGGLGDALLGLAAVGGVAARERATGRMDVDVIITCHDREGYVPHLMGIIGGWRRVRANVIVVYNGTAGMACDVKLPPAPKHRGDYEMVTAALRMCKGYRVLKLSCDTWPLRDDVVVELFTRLESLRLPCTGNYWYPGGVGLATDFVLFDRRQGDVLGAWYYREGEAVEVGLRRAVERVGRGFYEIPERRQVYGSGRPYGETNPLTDGCRWECPPLGLVGHHKLEENLRRSKVLRNGATTAVRDTRPGRRVVYCVKPSVMPFVKLFDGGYDHLVSHTFDNCKDLVSGGNTYQVNNGYNSECRDSGVRRSLRPRWQRYCDNSGGVTPVLPTLRDPQRLKELGRGYAGCVVLSPYSTWSNREYPLYSWLSLEKRLLDAKYRVVVLDDRTDRCDRFNGEKVLGADAELVTSIVFNAACVVGNDSGMCHLAGCVGTPAIALCAQTSGALVFGLYPTAHWLQGSLSCDGCYWQPPYHGDYCDHCCASLASITTTQVLGEIDKIVLTAVAGGRSMLHGDKLAVVRDLVLETNGLPGDMAEVGVYRGGTAKLIAYYAPRTPLHLFDTWTGRPDKDLLEDEGHLRGGCDDCDYDDVRAFVNSPHARYYKGAIPDTLGEVPCTARFRFVHLDVNLYRPTRDSLLYFSQKMLPGGVIIFDDYGWHDCPGIIRAVHEVLGWGTRLERPSLHQAVWRSP